MSYLGQPYFLLYLFCNALLNFFYIWVIFASLNKTRLSVHFGISEEYWQHTQIQNTSGRNWIDQPKQRHVRHQRKPSWLLILMPERFSHRALLCTVAASNPAPILDTLLSFARPSQVCWKWVWEGGGPEFKFFIQPNAQQTCSSNHFWS